MVIASCLEAKNLVAAREILWFFVGSFEVVDKGVVGGEPSLKVRAAGERRRRG